MSEEIGNSLIVDFGIRRRPSEVEAEDPVSEEAATIKTTKQVRFSEDTDLQCFQYPSREEVSERWISKKEKEIIARKMLRDIARIRHVLSTTPMEEVDKEILYACVGLEALITSQVMKFLKVKKRQHTRSIVEMQYHLGHEQLAAYAEKSSLESRERAHKLAAGYLEILSPFDGA